MHAVRRRLGTWCFWLINGPAQPWFSSLMSLLLANARVVYGDRSRLRVSPGATLANGIFNTMSGTIDIEADAVIGHNVSLLTGSHDYTKFGQERQRAVPPAGRDIVIETGAWIASNATILGPCRVGAHAVVAAGAVVHRDVPAYAIVAGVPARVIGDVRAEH